jgi:hypothetical protein
VRLVLTIAALGACNGGDKGTDTGGALEPTLTNVQAEVFTPSCGISTVCHAAPGSSGLVLDEGESYSHLVGVDSADLPGNTLVIPGDSAGSYLVAKLNGDVGIAGDQMPVGAALEPDRLQLVIDWIDAGAADD